MTSLLAPDNAVLVLIDHQVGLLRRIRDRAPEEVRQNVLGLAKSAKALNIPVVLTANAGGGGRLLPELRRLFHDRPVIGRFGTANPWHWPAFREAIECIGRRHVVIAGIPATAMQSAALDMARAGHAVHAVIDASGADSAVARELAVTRLREAGLRIHSWFSVAAEMLGDWRRDLASADAPMPNHGWYPAGA